MKITKTQLIKIIKEELDDIFASTAKYDAPKYHINDKLVTAATEAVIQQAASTMKASGIDPKDMQRIVSVIDTEIEEDLMDLLLPIASRIDHVTPDEDLREDTKASDEPYVSPFSPEQLKAMKAHTARAKELGPLKYGDDVDSPTLYAQMKDAILAAAEAMDAGDMESARAAFPEPLLKQLRPYEGPVGELPTAAQLAAMDDYDI